MSEESEPGDRLWRRIGCALLVVGVLLRIVTLVVGRTMFLDDAMLALNIVPRSWGELFEPAWAEQISPPLFLVAEKAAIGLFGVSAGSLRLVPVFASVLLLPVVWRLGARLLGERAGAIALFFAVASPLLFLYSDEVKSYGFDALMAAALPLLALRVRDDPERVRNWVFMGLAGLIAPFLGPVACFLLGGVATGFILAPTLRARQLVRMMLMGAVWLAVFITLYLSFYRPRADIPYLEHFWAGAYPRSGLLALRDIAGFGRILMDYSLLALDRPSPIPVALVVLLFAAIGVIVIVRRDRGAAALLFVPLMLGVVAAMARIYPPSPRLWLFAVPVAALVTAAGVDAVTGIASTRRSIVTVGCALALGLAPIGRIISTLVHRPARDPVSMRWAAEVWRANVQQGDVTYVNNRGLPSWIFYTTDWRSPDRSRLEWLMRESSALGPNLGHIPSRPHPVEREGDTLKWHGEDGTELLGIPTGIELIEGAPWRTDPDSGWAQNEGRRLLAEARECIWIVYVTRGQPHRERILRVLEGAGAVVDGLLERPHASVIGVRAPGGSRVCAPVPRQDASG